MDDRYCERCGEKLNPATLVELEMDTRTSLYHKPGEVPPEHSQGLFFFGRACAKAVLQNGGHVQTIGKNRPLFRPR